MSKYEENCDFWDDILRLAYIKITYKKIDKFCPNFCPKFLDLNIYGNNFLVMKEKNECVQGITD